MNTFQNTKNIFDPIRLIELTVIVNSFNRLMLLQKSMQSILNEMSRSGLAYSVVIFDANSTDGSIEWIKHLIQENRHIPIFLIVPSQKEPDSFSYGVNKASEFAIQKFPGLKYLLLYETDNFFYSHLPLLNAQKLLNENEHVSACGFTVKKYNGSPAGSGSKFPSFISLILGQQFSFLFKVNEMKIKWLNKDNLCYHYSDIVYTSPLLIKKESWIQISGFDYHNFPFSDCDIDLAKRLRSKGERLIVLNTNDVIHDNQELKSDWSTKRTLAFYQARFTYFLKHYGSWIKIITPLLFAMHALEFCILTVMVILKKRPKESLKTRTLLMRKVWSSYSL